MDVRAFINLAGLYRKYINKFVRIVEPLTDLQKGSPAKGADINWWEKEEWSFQALKEAIISEPCLKHPVIGYPFIIDSDSFQTSIGVCLQQYFKDLDRKEHLHLIAFESKKLTETEQ